MGLRILSKHNGVPNFLRAIRYSSLVSINIREGIHTRKPFKWRAKRNEAATRFLAFLSALDESVEEEVEKLKEEIEIPPEIIEKYSGFLRLVYRISKEEAIKTIKEAIAFRKLFKETIKGNREYLADVKLAEVFGGYGNFALGAAAIGKEALYVELNPVVTFFFSVYSKGKPEGFETKAEELLEYLKREIEDKYYRLSDGVPYVTFRARIIKCPNKECGAHIPLILVKDSPGVIRAGTKNKKYKDYYVKVEKLEDKDLPGSYSRKFEILEEGEKEYRCPECSRKIDIKELKNGSRKKLHSNALKDDIHLYGRKLEKLPWNYSVPIAYIIDRYDPPKRSEELLEKVKAAMEEIYENWEEYERYVPYEEIPEESIDKAPHGITEIRRSISYWTQLMSPRQLLAYAKIVKRVKENTKDEIQEWLAMILVKSLQGNVLTRYDYSARKISEISAQQSFSYVSQPAEISIPGEGKLSLTNTLKASYRLRYNFLNTGAIELEDRYNTIKTLNEAVQNLTRYPELKGKYHVVYADPPYVNMVPYWDLSSLYYAWLKKILGEPLPHTKYTLEEIRKLDLTKDDPKEFGEYLKEALEGIKRILNDEGVLIFQFAPPKSSYRYKGQKVTPTDVWRYTFAAFISAGLIPFYISVVANEGVSSKEYRGGGYTTKTSMILAIKPNKLKDLIPDYYLEAIEKFINPYIPGVYDKDKVAEELKEFVNTEEFARYLKEYFGYGSTIRIEDAVALSYTLIAPALAHALSGTDVGTIVYILKKIEDEISDKVANLIVSDLLGIENFLDIIRTDATPLIALGYIYGEIDLETLKVFLAKERRSNKLVLVDISEVEKAFFEKPPKEEYGGKRNVGIRRPKGLTRIAIERRAMEKYAPTLLMVFRTFEDKSYAEFLKVLSITEKELLRALRKALKIYKERLNKQLSPLKGVSDLIETTSEIKEEILLADALIEAIDYLLSE